MSNIIKTNDLPSLVVAMEANLLHTLEHLLAKWERTDFEYTPTLMWSITDTSFPLFNSVIGAHLTPDTVDQTISEIVERGRIRGVPILWWIDNGDHPADLGEHLQAHGFLYGGAAPGMMVDMDDVAWSRLPEDLTISEVENTTQAQAWSKALVEGNNMEDYTRELTEIVESRGFGADVPMRHFIGTIYDEVVATASVMLSDGVAGVYNIAVLPNMRGQGIGRAMTEAVMKVGYDEGYRFAVLQSSPMGLPLYENMGYKEVTQVHQYVWMPE